MVAARFGMDTRRVFALGCHSVHGQRTSRNHCRRGVEHPFWRSVLVSKYGRSRGRTNRISAALGSAASAAAVFHDGRGALLSKDADLMPNSVPPPDAQTVA